MESCDGKNMRLNFVQWIKEAVFSAQRNQLSKQVIKATLETLAAAW